MAKLYSKRRTPQPTELYYAFPEHVRTRILAIFESYSDISKGGFYPFLHGVGHTLFKAYGMLSASSFQAARRSENSTIEHFYCCNDEQAIDFIEVCFQQPGYIGRQTGVDEINQILREEGIGFELTPLIEHHINSEPVFYGKKFKNISIEYDYPRMIRRDEQLVHQKSVEPALQVLTDSRFRVAGQEMTKALIALRHDEVEDAITNACSAFESFLKTVCTIRGWPFDPDRDTCSKLVGVCRDNGLFPGFYAPMLEAVGTLRNKLGDAHGRGPAPSHQVSMEHAEHMVQLTSAHMMFLARRLGLA